MARIWYGQVEINSRGYVSKYRLKVALDGWLDRSEMAAVVLSEKKCQTAAEDLANDYASFEDYLSENNTFVLNSDEESASFDAEEYFGGVGLTEELAVARFKEVPGEEEHFDINNW